MAAIAPGTSKTKVDQTILGTAIVPKQMIRTTEAIVAQYKALDDARRKRARVRGRQSTILAGALGDTALNTDRKTLLGV